MPNRAIEIHDSVVTGVSFSRGEAQLHFSSAYIHPSEGVPGRDAGSGGVQEAILRLRDARVEGASELPVDLSDGQIQMENRSFDNEIPVPLRHKGGFDFRLQAVRQGQRGCSRSARIVAANRRDTEQSRPGQSPVSRTTVHGGFFDLLSLVTVNQAPGRPVVADVCL
jgi:hypothetical protein